jgi:hypothetical protein
MYSLILLCILFALVFIILLRISSLRVTCCVCTSVLSVLVYFSMCFFLSSFLLFLFCYVRCFFLPFTAYSFCSFYITSPNQKLNEYCEQTALENHDIWLFVPAKVGIFFSLLSDRPWNLHGNLYGG